MVIYKYIIEGKMINICYKIIGKFIIALFILLFLITYALAESNIAGDYIPLRENNIIDNGCKKRVSGPVCDISGDSENILFQVNIEGYQKSEVKLKNKNWDVISIPDESQLIDLGSPGVPIVNIMIAIPRDAEFDNVTLSPQLIKVVKGINLVPVQEPVPLIAGAKIKFNIDKKIYKSSEPYPESFYKLISVSSLGHYKIVLIETHPAQYIPATKELKFYDLSGTLTYKRGVNPVPIKFKNTDMEYLQKKLILNYAIAKTWENEVDSQLDCVIITADELYEAGNRLATWKTYRGLKSQAIKAIDILPDYPIGRDIPERIRLYIKDLWQNKGLKWVILIGDARDDFKNDLSYYVPPRWVVDPRPYPNADNGYIPCDYYYACLDGNWDEDNDCSYGEIEDEPDFFPEVFIGRIPIADKQKANNYINAIINYEQNPTGHNKIVLASGKCFPQAKGYEVDFKRKTVEPYLINKYSDIKHYHEYEGNLDYSTFINTYNTGIDALEYMDHGSYQAWYRNWGITRFLRVQDVKTDLTQTDNMPLVFAEACSTNRYDTYPNEECMGEAFINEIRASNYIGSTRVSWGLYDFSGDGLDYRFWKNYTIDEDSGTWQAGKALAFAKTELWQDYANSGLMKGDYKILFKTILEYETFGDPELSRMNSYNGFPDLTISQADISFSEINPKEGAIVTITTSISNIGNIEGNNVEIYLYDGNPDEDGNDIPDDDSNDKKIGEIFINKLGIQEKVSHLIDWDTTNKAGQHIIYAWADPDNNIAELHEDNNLAFANIEVQAKLPPETPYFLNSNPTSGITNTVYNFSVASSDPNGDMIKFEIKWDDGTLTSTVYGDYGADGYVTISDNHSWVQEKIYNIQARAIDIDNMSSGWSSPWEMEIKREPGWTTDDPVSPITTDPPLPVGTLISMFPDIACDNAGNVHISWFGKYDTDGAIYYRRLTNEGENWNNPFILANVTKDDNHYPVIETDKVNKLQILWDDIRNNSNFEIYRKESGDSGTSWNTDEQFSNTIVESRTPQVAINGQNIHAVWKERNKIYYRRSTDGGASWSAARVIVTSLNVCSRPNLACDSASNIFMVWTGQIGGIPQAVKFAFFSYSKDNGDNWQPAQMIYFDNSDANFEVNPDVCTDSAGNIHIVYETKSNHILYRKGIWSDGNMSLSGPSTVESNVVNSEFPSIITDYADNIYFFWQDRRDGNYEIYYKFKKADNLSWGQDTRITYADGSSLYPKTSLSNGYLHLVWQDNRDGDNRIYYNRMRLRSAPWVTQVDVPSIDVPPYDETVPPYQDLVPNETQISFKIQDELYSGQKVSVWIYTADCQTVIRKLITDQVVALNPDASPSWAYSKYFQNFVTWDGKDDNGQYVLEDTSWKLKISTRATEDNTIDPSDGQLGLIGTNWADIDTSDEDYVFTDPTFIQQNRKNLKNWKELLGN